MSLHRALRIATTLRNSRYPLPSLFFLKIPLPPRSTLFPYTTLFRSVGRILRIVGRKNRGQLTPECGGPGRHRRGHFGRTRSRRTYPRFEQIRLTLVRFHQPAIAIDRKSTRLNSSHSSISYAVFCLKK